jgi:hypothetical protein
VREHSEIAWNIAKIYSGILASETRDLASHIDEALKGRWQPIETAPKSKRVLVFVPIKNHRLVIGWQTMDIGLWLDEKMEPMSYPPTHWMPLPERPHEV